MQVAEEVLGEDEDESAPSHRQYKPCTTMHNGYDWGSSDVVSVVKQLEGLGVMVIPPGRTGDVDWGILAGKKA